MQEGYENQHSSFDNNVACYNGETWGSHSGLVKEFKPSEALFKDTVNCKYIV
jgi:hypothetical protein